MEGITHGIQEKDGLLQANKEGFKRSYPADLANLGFAASRIGETNAYGINLPDSGLPTAALPTNTGFLEKNESETGGSLVP